MIVLQVPVYTYALYLRVSECPFFAESINLSESFKSVIVSVLHIVFDVQVDVKNTSFFFLLIAKVKKRTLLTQTSKRRPVTGIPPLTKKKTHTQNNNNKKKPNKQKKNTSLKWLAAA
jgi:hypothetical protein